MTQTDMLLEGSNFKLEGNQLFLTYPYDFEFSKEEFVIEFLVSKLKTTIKN